MLLTKPLTVQKKSALDDKREGAKVWNEGQLGDRREFQTRRHTR